MSRGALRLHHRLLQRVRLDPSWRPGLKVAVAVSGGLDSVVLLHLLLATRRAHQAELQVVHVHHGTPQADEFEAFVRARAAQVELPYTVARASPAGWDEASLRAARYQLLTRLAVDRVALAHHRRDQAETMLLRLLRGTGTGGLAAMSELRGTLWRPLLEVEPDSLRAWALRHGLTWVEDASNRSPRYTRNRLRALWPALDEVQPGAAKAVASAARWFAEDEALLARLAADAPRPLTWAWLHQAPAPLARRAIRAWDHRLTLAQAQQLLDGPPPITVAGRTYGDQRGELVLVAEGDEGPAPPPPSRGGGGC